MKSNIISNIQEGGAKMKGLMILLAIMMAGIASAATVNTPTDILRTATATVNISTTFNAAVNCTVLFTSASTGDTLSVWVFNRTVSINHADNVSVNTWLVKDGKDYVASGTCYNYTGSSETITAATLSVDNVAPAACTWVTSIASGSVYSKDQAFTISGANATIGYIQFGSNGYKVMSESPDDTFTFSDMIPGGIYTVSAKVSDGLNDTACASYDYISVQGKGGDTKTAGVAIGSATGAKAAGPNNSNTIVIIGLALAGLLIYSNNKK